MKNPPSSQSPITPFETLMLSFKSFGQKKDLEQIDCLGALIHSGSLVVPLIQSKKESQLLFLMLGVWSENLKGWTSESVGRDLSPETQLALGSITKGLLDSGCKNFLTPSDWKDAWTYALRIPSLELWNALQFYHPLPVSLPSEIVEEGQAISTAQWALRIGNVEMLDFALEKGWTPTESDHLWMNAWTPSSLEWVLKQGFEPPADLPSHLQLIPRKSSTAIIRRSAYTWLIENFPNLQSSDEALKVAAQNIFQLDYADVQSALKVHNVSPSHPLFLSEIPGVLYQKIHKEAQSINDITSKKNAFSLWSYDYAAQNFWKEPNVGIALGLQMLWVNPKAYFVGIDMEDRQKLQNNTCSYFQAFKKCQKLWTDLNSVDCFKATLKFFPNWHLQNSGDFIHWALDAIQKSDVIQPLGPNPIFLETIYPVFENQEKTPLKPKLTEMCEADQILWEWSRWVWMSHRSRGWELNSEQVVLDKLKNASNWPNLNNPGVSWLFQEVLKKVPPSVKDVIESLNLLHKIPESEKDSKRALRL